MGLTKNETYSLAAGKVKNDWTANSIWGKLLGIGWCQNRIKGTHAYAATITTITKLNTLAHSTNTVRTSPIKTNWEVNFGCEAANTSDLKAPSRAPPPSSLGRILNVTKREAIHLANGSFSLTGSVLSRTIQKGGPSTHTHTLNKLAKAHKLTFHV